jgi:APA family basic amino acid/polyamine antiporter
MRDPQRTLPFGLVWGTVIVMVLYALINLVYFVALPLDEIAATPRIGETAAAALFGSGGGKLMSFAILVSTFGCLSATILFSPRIYLPMSRDGVFFRSLGAVHPRFHTPGRSLWAQSLWAVVLTLSGTYEQIYTYVIFGGLLFHAATAGAVFVLRRKYPDVERPYRVFGYPWVPLLFILASVLLIGNTLLEKPIESLIGLVFIAAGIPAYLWWRSHPES